MKTIFLMAFLVSQYAVSGQVVGNGGGICSNGGACGQTVTKPATVLIVSNKTLVFDIDGDAAELLFTKKALTTPINHVPGGSRDWISAKNVFCWRDLKASEANYRCQIQVDVSDRNP